MTFASFLAVVATLVVASLGGANTWANTDDVPLRALTQQAEQGSAPAQFELGQRFENGNGVAENAAQAVTWYRKAAAAGNADAQLRLAWCYNQGDGVAEDPVESLKWLQRAAANGKAVAQYRLAWLYMNGDGVEQSVPEARQWFEKAARQHFADAQNALGYTYHHKTPGDDVVRAAQWYLAAARQDHIFAKGNLADLMRASPKLALHGEANVFGEPAASADVVGLLHAGDVVYRLRQDGAWAAVVDDRKRFVGWVAVDQL